jgi:hypothetical protein
MGASLALLGLSRGESGPASRAARLRERLISYANHEQRMSVRVDLDELLDAFEWVSAGETAAVSAEAYIRRTDGQIVWCGEGIDEEPPDDIEDGTLYIAVPHKNELDLGRSLALRFVEEHLPRSLEEVEIYFRKRGAYSRFKSLLERVGQLDAWHRYEQGAKEESLRQWCVENGFVAGRKSAAG